MQASSQMDSSVYHRIGSGSAFFKEQIEHYKREADRLSWINDLHVRLAGVTDIQGIIESLSVGLMQKVRHDVLALRYSGAEDFHICCSSHGPDRRRVTDALTKALDKVDCAEGNGVSRFMDFHILHHQVYCGDIRAQIVCLREIVPFVEEERDFLEQALAILEKPLHRGLHYQEIFRQAYCDTLTGLANRRAFDERIDSMIDNAQRYGHPLTLASMDLDKFKQINDTCGHHEGDNALRAVAAILMQEVRSGDLLARMGGDEFMLVLPYTDIKAAQGLAQRLIDSVSRLDIRSADGEKLTVSVGLCQWHQGLDSHDLLARSDEALYRAKFSGRSRTCVDQ